MKNLVRTIYRFNFFILSVIVLCSGSLFAQSNKVLPPKYGIYHSAFPLMGATEDSVEIDRIKNFETLVNKELVWVYFSNNWFKGIKFPRKECETVSNIGKIPFIRIMPRSDYYDGVLDPVYTLKKIYDGEFDSELNQWARDARDFGKPIMAEFGTEVNGSWFSWSGVLNGGGVTNQFGDTSVPDGPELFRETYKKIIDICRDNGAFNITWCLHLNAGSAPDENWNSYNYYYPGDDYIDWIGLSIYGVHISSHPPSKFSDVLRNVYPKITSLSPDKPIAIFEFGTIEDSAYYDKGLWIRDVFECLSSGEFPRIKAINYWHSAWINADGSVSNMRIDSSPSSIKEYRVGISNPLFISYPIISK
ncbi:MAG TPA: glycosyl hydrolase [Ignavibacteria bacterium]|nr:glycosyl hydrolase [Ignavibacteria bacterium]